MTRVRRLRDGKVFSGPRGVAMEVDKPIARAVYYCCRGYLPSVDGETYEWAYDDDEDRGKSKHSEISYWERREKWISRTWITKWRASFIKAWLDSIDDPERWRKITEIAQGVCATADTLDEQYKWKPTPQNLSRHLYTYLPFYRRAFGMYQCKISVPGYRGRIFKFIQTESDPEFEVILKELADSEDWGRGKPVIRISDGMRFRSMSEAEHITKVPYYRIYHCCEGDIEHYEIPLTGERMSFKYASEVDRK